MSIYLCQKKYKQSYLLQLVVILCVDTGFHSVLLILALAVPVEELFPTGAGECVALSALFLFL